MKKLGKKELEIVVNEISKEICKIKKGKLEMNLKMEEFLVLKKKGMDLM
jgi:hypothetical protein